MEQTDGSLLEREVNVAMNGLEVSHLKKLYGDVTVVDDLSFHVEPGEIFGLIGPNGAGKSTTMMMIIGLLQPDGGTISFDGVRFNHQNVEMRSRLGIVPQELAIYPELTTIQNLRFFGGLNGVRGSRLKERVDYVLDLIGLRQNADHTPSTFSGGMSRRLNFGIALIHEPRFVVLDEPTVGIDPQSRSSLLDAVRQLGRDGVGVLYASHYMDEVEAVCHRVAIMDRGKLLKEGTLDQLLDRSRIDLCVSVSQLLPELRTELEAIAEVLAEPDGTIRILVRETLEVQKQGNSAHLRRVLELLERTKTPLLGIKTQETSLETLFLSLTGRTLRD
ncbi:MAG: ABC transporter ATP-binding protein [Planctomycetota bacterium]